MYYPETRNSSSGYRLWGTLMLVYKKIRETVQHYFSSPPNEAKLNVRKQYCNFFNDNLKISCFKIYEN